jgi:hypothetical protein
MIARTAAPPKVNGVFGAAQVGDEGLYGSLVAGEPAQQAGAGQQQERGHEEGSRSAAGT